MNGLIFSRTWEQIQAMQQKTYKPELINTTAPGDHGCDPLGDGTFRMVPSGDVVNRDEMLRRLTERGKL